MQSSRPASATQQKKEGREGRREEEGNEGEEETLLRVVGTV